MKISTQITLPEYIKLQYILSYNRPAAIWVNSVGGVMFIVAIINTITESDNADFSVGYMLGAYLILRAILIYFFAKKNFKSNTLLGQPVNYEFLTDKLVIDNSVSHAEVPWENFYNVKEFKNWFLLYQSTTMANLIPKTDLSEQEIAGIRYVLQNAPVKKKKLKK